MNSPVSPRAPAAEPIERETIRRVAFRLIPLLMLGYFGAYLDRVNVGFAALTMNKQLGFSSAVFGFGAGLFFIGYFLAEIPSNLILNRVGARRWLARILITWGIISGATAFVWNDWSFYSIRVLLGLAEAGFYPGVVLYLTWWFPSHYRTRMMCMFQTASTLSSCIGPPISAHLMNLDGILGLMGWQWLFILEALPPIIMSFVIWTLLTDRPQQAKWLRPEQREWLTSRLDAERAQREAIRHYSLGQALTNRKVWLLTLAYFCQTTAGYGALMFMPLIVRGMGVSQTNTGWLTAIPYLCACVAMNVWGWHSDKTGERTWHVAGACMLCSAGFGACILIGPSNPVLLLVALSCGVMGRESISPTFWALPSALLTGTAAAGGIALINSIGNLGGFLGPWVFGLVKDASGSDNLALLVLAVAPLISVVALVVVGHDRRLERIPAQARPV
jgi:ACS family tartrate transporter-like MFS transporter